MKTISIFGSTGTIGEKAFRLAQDLGFQIKGLSCDRNYQKLIEQAKSANPECVYIADAEGYQIVSSELRNSGIQVFSGSDISDLATQNVDCCVMAIAGIAGLKPTFAALGQAKRLAIATKEVIISAGSLFMEQAKQLGTEIIPVDSEHNSIYQCLLGENPSHVKEIILTASGGPFVDFEEDELRFVKVEDALKHPNWNMGKKITVDSATLMNKALEIIEASYLFNLPINQISPLVHPNSIIHGLVKFCDNSFKAAISFPDMILPISYALTYPERKFSNLPDLNFATLGALQFRKLKPWQARNVNLAYLAAAENKVIALNLLNEIAVDRFLKKQIAFFEIYPFIVKFLELCPKENVSSIEDVSQNIYSIQKLILSNS